MLLVLNESLGWTIFCGQNGELLTAYTRDVNASKRAISDLEAQLAATKLEAEEVEK